MTASHTSSGVVVKETHLTTSTVYETITKTICTKCAVPATVTPHAEVTTTVIVYYTTTTCPVTATYTKNGVPVVTTTVTESVVPQTVTKTITYTAAQAPAEITSPAKGAEASPEQGAPEAAAGKGAPVTLTIEQTLIPTPEYATQTIAGAAAASPAAVGGSEASPAEGESPAGVPGVAGYGTGTATGAPVKPTSPPISPEAFKGAATRVSGGVIGVVAAFAATLMLL